MDINLETEQWTKIVVSKHPQVQRYSVNRKGDIRNDDTQKIMKQTSAPGGYKNVSLTTTVYASVSLFVHRVVATAFIPNPHSYPTVNHINHTPNDNRVENLEWATYAMQNIHRRPLKSRMSTPVAQYHQEDIHYTNIIKIWDSCKHAATSLATSNKTTLREACKQNMVSRGYRWKYHDNYIPSRQEEWKIIPGTNTSVSSLGRVKQPGFPIPHFGTPQLSGLMKIGIERQGYWIHRLVAKLFVAPPDHLNGIDVDSLWVVHIDGDNKNNDSLNLRWKSPPVAKSVVLTRSMHAVEKVDCNNIVVTTYRGMLLAAKANNVSHKVMTRLCRSKIKGRNMLNGFLFRLKSN
jgi:hypothetical protein